MQLDPPSSGRSLSPPYSLFKNLCSVAGFCRVLYYIAFYAELQQKFISAFVFVRPIGCKSRRKFGRLGRSGRERNLVPLVWKSLYLPPYVRLFGISDNARTFETYLNIYYPVGNFKPMWIKVQSRYVSRILLLLHYCLAVRYISAFEGFSPQILAPKFFC